MRSDRGDDDEQDYLDDDARVRKVDGAVNTKRNPLRLRLGDDADGGTLNLIDTEDVVAVRPALSSCYTQWAEISTHTVE